MKMQLTGRVAGMIVLLMLCVGAASAQTPSAPNASQPAGQEAPKEGMPVALTLKRAIELALQNSKEIQVAKIQASVADRAAQITKAQFMPNLYAGSGAGYTYGIPETPGGRAPSIFNVSYTEQVFNEPLRGQTKAQLTKAQVVERILQLEGREDELEVFLRYQLGLSEAQSLEVTPEELPGEAEQAGDNLVAMAMTRNAGLQLAESDVRAKEFRWKGARRGYFPTLELVTVYSVLARFNNYTQFFTTFQRNNFNAGIDVHMPIFSAQTKAAVGMAQINLEAAKVNLTNKRTELTADVRQKTRRVRERDAAKEVARLELQLAQQNVAVEQAQFAEGKRNLREVEKARLEENEKWMAYLDANFQKQQAQLELLKTAGQ